MRHEHFYRSFVTNGAKRSIEFLSPISKQCAKQTHSTHHSLCVNAITPNTRLNSLGLTPRSWASTVKLLCWMKYSYIATEQLSSSIWDIPASALTDVSSSSSARPCPTGMFTLDCEYCNCIPGTNTCRGTKYGQYVGCYGNSPALPANPAI